MIPREHLLAISTQLSIPISESDFASRWVSRSIMYCDAEVLYTIIRYFKPTRVLELGTFLGLSASIIALALRDTNGGYVDTIDIMKPGAPYLDEQDGELPWHGKVRGELLLERDSEVNMVTAEELEFLSITKPDGYDLIFEDTNHGTELVKQSIPLMRLVTKGPILLHNADWPSIRAALEQLELVERCFFFDCVNGSSIAVIDVD